MKIFNRTLLKKILAPPQPLHDHCELINRTLHEIFSAGSIENFSRPEYFLLAVLKENLKIFAIANAQNAYRVLRYALTCTKKFPVESHARQWMVTPPFLRRYSTGILPKVYTKIVRFRTLDKTCHRSVTCPMHLTCHGSDTCHSPTGHQTRRMRRICRILRSKMTRNFGTPKLPCKKQGFPHIPALIVRSGKRSAKRMWLKFTSGFQT